MADVQADIARICRLLDSDRATERKQNSIKLKNLLTETEIKKLLDRNSDSDKKNVVTWEYVFQSVQVYVNREIDLLIRQKPRNSQTVSSIVANNKEKKRKEVTAFLKYILKTADERERCRLNGKDVVQHITAILKNQDMNNMFIADYQNILLKFILSSKTYRCEITCKMWHELIDIFSQMITSCTGERSFCAKIFFYLVMAASNQVDIQSSQLFIFFTNVFVDIRNENNSQVLEYLLGSLTSFCGAVAIDCRRELCRLGEDIIPSLLQIWNKPHPIIKERLVQFMRLQVRIHHPNGIHVEKNGAWSCNTTHWKKCLQKMYEAISNEILQISGRIRGQSIKLESGLKQPLIELAADVCHQIFWFHCNSSVMPLDSSTFDGSSTSKRQKLEVGWNVLRDVLSNGQETPALLAWLKIAASLLQKFPNSLPRGEYVQLLTSLHHLQMDGKRQETITAVMVCLKSATLCHVYQLEDSVEEVSAKSTWKNIWLATLRSISWHDLEEPGFELLEKIVQKKLTEPDVEPWKLLSETGCNSTHRSLQFLWTYLNTLPLPEHFYYNTQVLSMPPSQLYPLRHQLLDWLLPSTKNVEQQGQQVDSYYSKILSRLPIELLSRVLVTLTQRIFNKSNLFLKNLDEERKDTDQFEKDLNKMESLYLLSSFDKKVVTELVDPVVLNTSKCVSLDNNTVEEVLNYLILRLLEISEKLLETSSGELNISITSPQASLSPTEKRLEVLTRYCSLSTKVMGFLLHFNAFSSKKLYESSLYTTTMKVLKIIASGISEFLCHKREPGTSILGQSFIAALSDLFLCKISLSRNYGKNTCMKTVMDVVRSVTPKELCDHLLEFVINEPRQLNKSRVVTDEFDGSFDDNDVTMDDFELDDRVQSPFTDQDQFSEDDKFRLSCIEMLCTLCSTSISPNYIVDHIQNVVFGYFENENFDIVKPGHSNLFFTAAFLLGSDPINARHLLIVLQQLRLLISKCRKSQDKCEEGLRLLTFLAHCLAMETEEHEDKKEARELALHLLRAFWNLRETNYQSSVRLQLAKCMDAFIRFDPKKSWAFFDMKVNNNDSAVHISCVFPSLFCDPSHRVRMYMAEAIGILFITFNSENIGVPENPAIQDKLFDIVTDALAKSLVVEKNNQSDDENVNRSSSLLSALKTVITCSCWCEPKVMCCLFQATQEQQLNQKIVAKVLKQISAIMDYESTHHFIKAHIGRIVDTWLDRGFRLADFPYKTLSFTSLANFLRNHHSLIMPHLIWRFKEKDSLKTIGREIGQDGDWMEFLVDDFCQIMSIIVPCFAEQSRQTMGSSSNVVSSSSSSSNSHAYECHEFLENVLQKEVTDKLMVKKFDELVVELLFRMHDAPSELSGGSQFLRDYDPPTNKPHFSSHAIKATLDYLTGCHDGSNNTLVSILCKRKENIQKILLRLTEHLEETHVFHKRRSYLSMYRVFVLMLLQELDGGLAGTWAFVVRDIVYTLIRIMANNCSKYNATKLFTIQGIARGGHMNITVDIDLFTASCDLLFHVCKMALSICPQEIGNHLLAIVNEIIPFVSNKDNRAKKAVALLKFLIVENKSCLKSSISLLDPFPDQSEFAIFNEAYWSVRQNKDETTLLAEIEHYLLIGHRRLSTSRLEGLRHLCSRFSYYKNELRDVMKNGVNGSSLGVLLMKLLRRLIMLCRNTTNSEVKIEVGKLIAEVGLPVFYVSSFNPTASADEEYHSYTEACEVFRGDEEKCRNCRILHLLNDYLIDKSIKKVAASASCLKDVFQKPAIITLMKAYEEQKIDHLFGYLEPFRSTRRTKKPERNSTPETTKRLNEILNDSDIWNPVNFNSHDQWISSLTSSLILSGALKNDVLECLAPLCKEDASFADHIFPYLIHDFLLGYGDVYRELLSEQIRKIFGDFICSSSNRSRASTPLITATVNSVSNTTSQNSIHSLLNVINYLRKQPRLKSGKSFTTSWESNFWLDLNFLELAEAALKSSAYCTAILCIEIWRNVQRTTSSFVEHQTLDSQDVPVEISGESTDDNQETNYQSILFEAYVSIGEPDAVYGSGSGLSTDLKARIHTYEQEKSWGKALRAYDLHCRQSGNLPCVGTIQALQTFGLEHITYNYLKGLGDENQEEFLELQYESAWRNRIWNFDKDISSKFSGDNKGFNQCVYDNIQSLKNKDLKLFHSSTNESRLKIVEELCQTNTESLWEVYPHICQLQCLVELEQAKNIFEGSGNHEMMLNNWILNMPDNFNEIELLEPILSLRTILFQELLGLSINEEMKHSLLQGLVKHCENVSRLARHAGRYQISEKAITTIKELQNTGETALTTVYSWKIEEAKVFWFQKEEETAKRLLRQINQTVEHKLTTSKSLYAQTMGLYGSWLAETRSENPNTIMEKYLDKAVELVESCSDKQESSIEAFLSLARFSDSQYKNIQDYTKSWAYENKQSIMYKLQSEIASLKEHGVKEGRYIRELSLQSESDEQELVQMKEDQLKYLQKAVRNYIRCLQVGEKYDFKIFRICSLWMENSNDDSINKMVEEGIFSDGGKLLIQSRKFLPLMYQLAARLGARTHQNELFQRTLTKLISQAAIDHPHHVVWIILALCNADKDNKYISGGKKSGRLSRTTKNSQVNSYVDEDRVKAARAVIGKVRSSKRNIITSLEKLSEAYIELAYYDVSQYKAHTGPLSLPDVTLKKFSNFKNVALPTTDIKVDPCCQYKDILSIEKFDSKYQLCGGINLPKILVCIGSDGIKRRQLVKGKDDLRQDAVMQQVFGMVNTLLQNNVETRKRNLKIRTYKVVPLSQRSGLVEWCEQTTPLGNYLIGGQGKDLGAHGKYHPKDWSPIECRKHMQAINRTDINRRYKVYKTVTNHFQPVFRHFFLEQFLDPSIWFERRLGYTRSVATASIVGYIVGLGDRHVQNILIDCNTAELIHIDLGVAFEQGKMLPTPETVPFRLTRDLVDGMGISGVEGVFRRCCEKTMEVMRTSQEALLTIVEVLLYDPLYVWTLSPLQAMSLQRKADMDTSEVAASNTDVLDTDNEGRTRGNLDETSVNKMAERVLVRLRQKLDGLEDGTLLSVKGQVNHLIREARDPKNLCRLFPGWQPWI